MTTQRIAELEAEVMRLREALVESCMEVESCLDEDPRKTLSNLKDYWFSSGMAEQQSIIATNRIVELDLEVLTLRKALDTYFEPTLDSWKREHVLRQALSTPFTPTALHELIEKVEKRTIERCANRLMNFYDSCCTRNIKDFSKAIRALPVGQIKLEELL